MAHSLPQVNTGLLIPSQAQLSDSHTISFPQPPPREKHQSTLLDRPSLPTLRTCIEMFQYNSHRPSSPISNTFSSLSDPHSPLKQTFTDSHTSPSDYISPSISEVTSADTEHSRSSLMTSTGSEADGPDTPNTPSSNGSSWRPRELNLLKRRDAHMGSESSALSYQSSFSWQNEPPRLIGLGIAGTEKAVPYNSRPGSFTQILHPSSTAAPYSGPRDLLLCSSGNCVSSKRLPIPPRSRKNSATPPSANELAKIKTVSPHQPSPISIQPYTPTFVGERCEILQAKKISDKGRLAAERLNQSTATQTPYHDSMPLASQQRLYEALQISPARPESTIEPDFELLSITDVQPHNTHDAGLDLSTDDLGPPTAASNLSSTISLRERLDQPAKAVSLDRQSQESGQSSRPNVDQFAMLFASLPPFSPPYLNPSAIYEQRLKEESRYSEAIEPILQTASLRAGLEPQSSIPSTPSSCTDTNDDSISSIEPHTAFEFEDLVRDSLESAGGFDTLLSLLQKEPTRDVSAEHQRNPNESRLYTNQSDEPLPVAEKDHTSSFHRNVADGSNSIPTSSPRNPSFQSLPGRQSLSPRKQKRKSTYNLKQTNSISSVNEFGQASRTFSLLSIGSTEARSTFSPEGSVAQDLRQEQNRTKDVGETNLKSPVPAISERSQPSVAKLIPSVLPEIALPKTTNSFDQAFGVRQSRKSFTAGVTLSHDQASDVFKGKTSLMSPPGYGPLQSSRRQDGISSVPTSSALDRHPSTFPSLEVQENGLASRWSSGSDSETDPKMVNRRSIRGRKTLSFSGKRPTTSASRETLASPNTSKSRAAMSTPASSSGGLFQTSNKNSNNKKAFLPKLAILQKKSLPNIFTGLTPSAYTPMTPSRTQFEFATPIRSEYPFPVIPPNSPSVRPEIQNQNHQRSDTPRTRAHSGDIQSSSTKVLTTQQLLEQAKNNIWPQNVRSSMQSHTVPFANIIPDIEAGLEPNRPSQGSTFGQRPKGYSFSSQPMQHGPSIPKHPDVTPHIPPKGLRHMRKSLSWTLEKMKANLPADLFKPTVVRESGLYEGQSSLDQNRGSSMVQPEQSRENSRAMSMKISESSKDTPKVSSVALPQEDQTRYNQPSQHHLGWADGEKDDALAFLGNALLEVSMASRHSLASTRPQTAERLDDDGFLNASLSALIPDSPFRSRIPRRTAKATKVAKAKRAQDVWLHRCSLTEFGQQWVMLKGKDAYDVLAIEGPSMLVVSSNSGVSRFHAYRGSHEDNSTGSGTDGYGSSDGGGAGGGSGRDSGRTGGGAGGHGGPDDGGDSSDDGDDEPHRGNKEPMQGDEDEDDEDVSTDAESEDDYGVEEGVSVSAFSNKVAPPKTTSGNESESSDDVPLGVMVRNPEALQKALREQERRRHFELAQAGKERRESQSSSGAHRKTSMRSTRGAERPDRQVLSNGTNDGPLNVADLTQRLFKVQERRERAGSNREASPLYLRAPCPVEQPASTLTKLARAKSVSSESRSTDRPPTLRSRIPSDGNVRAKARTQARGQSPSVAQANPLLPTNAAAVIAAAQQTNFFPRPLRSPTLPTTPSLTAVAHDLANNSTVAKLARARTEIRPSGASRSRSNTRAPAPASINTIVPLVPELLRIGSPSIGSSSGQASPRSPHIPSFGPMTVMANRSNGSSVAAHDTVPGSASENASAAHLNMTNPRPAPQAAPSLAHVSPSMASSTWQHEESQTRIPYKVFISNRQRFATAEVPRSARARDLVINVIERENIPQDQYKGGWVVFDCSQQLGIERPLREYELVHEVADTRANTETDYFLLKRTELSPYLSIRSIPVSSPVLAGWVYVQDRKKKWNKRWLELRDHALFHAKSDKGKDEVQICQMSTFDVYLVDTATIKSPKAHGFAVRSQDKISMFEKPEQDYIHYLCLSDPAAHRDWVRAIMNARTYILRQERSVLFHVGPSNEEGHASNHPTLSTTANGGLSRRGTTRRPTGRPSDPSHTSSSGPPQAEGTMNGNALPALPALLGREVREAFAGPFEKGSLLADIAIKNAAEALRSGTAHVALSDLSVQDRQTVINQEAKRREENLERQRKLRAEGQPLIDLKRG